MTGTALAVLIALAAVLGILLAAGFLALGVTAVLTGLWLLIRGPGRLYRAARDAKTKRRRP